MRISLHIFSKRYEVLLASAHFVSQRLKLSDRKPECVCVLAEGGPDYVAATWAGWLSGRIVVPLAPSHPDQELEYFIKVSESLLLFLFLIPENSSFFFLDTGRLMKMNPCML